MLSGTDVDTSLFNLDSFTADFAVISPADAAPVVNLDGAFVRDAGTGQPVVLGAGSPTPGPLSTDFVGSLPDYRTEIGDSGSQSSSAPPPPVVLRHTPDVAGVGSDAFLDESPAAPLDGANATEKILIDHSIVVDSAPKQDADESVLPADGDVLRTPAVVQHSPSVGLNDAGEEAFEPLGSSDPGRSEGGMIPLESLVAAFEDGSLAGSEAPTRMAATSRQDLSNTEHGAATFAAADLSGELARAVAFEVIEAESVPIATASARVHDRALAAANIDAALTLAQLSSSLGPIPLAAFAGALAESHNSQVVIEWVRGGSAALPAGELVEAGRGDVASGASEQGAEDNSSPLRPVPATVAEWRTPMDVSAFLVVLALERFLSTNRRRDREVAGPPKPVCRRGTTSNNLRRKAEC